MPDVIACFEGKACYLELKALPHTNVQIRTSQYGWIRHNNRPRCRCFILNQDPKTSAIQVWDADCIKIEEGRKVHVKVISDPLAICAPHELKPILEELLK